MRSHTTNTCEGIRGMTPHAKVFLVDEESYHEYLRMFDAPIKEIGRLAEAADNEKERRLLLHERSELSRKALSHYQELYSIATIEGKRVRLESIFPGGN